MPGIVRDSGRDVAGGAIISGSQNVYANNYVVARRGDRVAPHGRNQHRAAVMAGFSPNVFANGINVCRAGDPASCGHSASGSNNVFVN